MAQEAASGAGSGLGAPDHPGAGYRSPSVVMRLVAPPLLAYHVLILVGAYLIVRGDSAGSLPLLYIGLALVVAGIATEAAILAWSARLTQRSAVAPGSVGAPVGHTETAAAISRRFCIGCGWTGEEARTLCPRCARPLIRRSRPDRSTGVPEPPL